MTRSSPLRPSRTSTPSVPCRVSAPEVPRAIRRRRAVEVALSETRSVTKVRVPAGRPEKTTRRSAPSPSRRSRTPSRDAVPVRSRSAVGPSSPTSSESVPRPSAERRRRSRLIVGEASTASTATVRDTGPEVATPPFAVPPSSARRTGITAVPSASAAGVNDSTPDGEICGGDANSPGTDGSPRHARPTHRPRMAEQLGRAGDRRREGHGRPEVAEPVGRTDGHRVGAGDGLGPDDVGEQRDERGVGRRLYDPPAWLPTALARRTWRTPPSAGPPEFDARPRVRPARRHCHPAGPGVPGALSLCGA